MKIGKNIQFNHAPSETAKKFLLYPLSVGNMICGPSLAVERNDHNLYGYQLSLVLNGTGRLEANNRVWTIQPGHFIYLDMNKGYKLCSASDHSLELLWIHFDGIPAPHYFELVEASEIAVFEVSIDRLQKIRQSLQEMLNLLNYRPPSMEVRSSLLITQTLSEIVLDKMEGAGTWGMERSASVCDEIFVSLRYMEERYNQPLRLDEVAEIAGMSTFHFARLFKKSTGFTVMEYLIKFRVTQAKKLLSTTQLPISEIAESTGFQDQSYFAKLYKRYEKITPKRYRDAHADTTTPT
ncbi:helix-turn-helix domain-containing protein [Paenibacillus allorhizosphaerae]|uniref:HTH-type transcriptional activator RhaR n=1 Tax=Paenibacillus allorhizosphaerae TaxID=2849866 RepID=A0ABM8VAP5_9BACL|nr:AraC family transcriptional regulator [Paenibacillus allorhizosphaerae]CAG7617054.1 HTH-type transcriptional activator RhaR [Paenibacillus allorhizosphaerae]